MPSGLTSIGRDKRKQGKPKSSYPKGNKVKPKSKNKKRKEWIKQNRSKWATKAQRRKKERKPSGLAWQEMAASKPISTTRGKSIENGPCELKERGKSKANGP